MTKGLLPGAAKAPVCDAGALAFEGAAALASGARGADAALEGEVFGITGFADGVEGDVVDFSQAFS
jgi:hypothetical protein